jgi:PAS domain S-box-containing protein
MWEKVVLNLLSNAFKFTFEGGVAVAVHERPGAFELSVADTGVGIAAGELPRVFERFHRVEGARSRTHEGSGIGLALVKELVRLHGGDVEVASEPGRGSTFTVTIPRGRAHLPAERVEATPAVPLPAGILAVPYVEEAQRWIDDDAAAGGAKDAARILVADDNADMRAYLQRVLGARWTVEAVPDGAAALEAARARPPDLVLTDVMMPRLDGFGLLRALRAEEALREVPVVMLSARAGEEARIEGLQTGADDYLVKPFSARELAARVASQLNLHRARREAHLQKRHLFSLFMQAPTPIAILRGPGHVIELANPPCCAVWGRRHEDLIGRPLLDALPELRSQGFHGLLDGVLATGQPYVGREAPAQLDRRGDGRLDTTWFNFVYAPLRDVEGRIDGVLVLAFDVTHETLARREMETLRAAAEQASRAKDEFLAMLSHELRNPLAPITTALELMRLRDGEGIVERERAIIDRQVTHLTRLVDDLLDVSRVTRGTVALRRRPLELAQVVAKGIEMASPLLETRQHRLTMDVAAAGLPVHGDEHRLAQVVSNLVANAAKYTPPGGHVTVRAAREGGTVALRVRDDGLGIDAQLLPRVFDLFVQGPRGLDRAHGGLGLGLAIVRSLVELHGGSVEAASEGHGRGSEFTVRLPLLDGAPLGTLTAERASPVTVAHDAPRVLVVDDNRDAANLLAEALGAAGYVTRTAYDAATALEAARSFQPAVALLDLGLPVMDGYELARQIRQTPEAGGIRLVAVTGYGQAAHRDQAREAGFDDHLVKPIDVAAVPGLLQRLVRSDSA